MAEPPASTVQEAADKGLLDVNAVRGMYDDTAEEYLAMMKADASNERAIGPTHAALKKLCDLIAARTENDGGGGDSDGRAPLIDVGCGPGTNLIWLTQQEEYTRTPRPLIGLDLSPAMINLSKKESASLATDVEFRVGDMLRLDFLADSSAAGMFNGCIIQHVDLDGVRGTLSEAARVLRPGGVLLLQFWIGDDAPMPGPEGAAFIGWKVDTVRDAVRGTDGLSVFEESRHMYEEFDMKMPYVFFYIRKKE